MHNACFEMDDELSVYYNVFFRYWKIPFDPFRVYGLLDDKIFRTDKSACESEQDVSLTTVSESNLFT